MRTTKVEERLRKAQEVAKRLEKGKETIENVKCMHKRNVLDSDAQIAHLTSTIDELKQAKIDLEQKLDEMTKENVKKSKIKDNSKFKKSNEFYSLLTGIDVEFKTESKSSKTFECRFSNGPKGKAFLLHHDENEEEIEYNPEVPETSGLRRKSIGRALLPFPEFMREDIVMDANDAPRFLFRILRSVHENQ